MKPQEKIDMLIGSLRGLLDSLDYNDTLGGRIHSAMDDCEASIAIVENSVELLGSTTGVNPSLSAAARICHDYGLNKHLTVNQSVDIVHDIAGIIGRSDAGNFTDELIRLVKDVAASLPVAAACPKLSDRAVKLVARFKFPGS